MPEKQPRNKAEIMAGIGRLRHGHAKVGKQSRTFVSWRDMRTRCKNKKRDMYKYYGGRGIVVCKRWDSFENFLSDMGERPAGMSLDRKNNNGNYTPKNCRWATLSTQRKNSRSKIVWITHKGVRLCRADWCKLLGLNMSKVRGRMSSGDTFQQAISEKNRIRRDTKLIRINGESNSLKGWCRVAGIAQSAAVKRIALGWSIKKVLFAPKNPGRRTDLELRRKP